MIFKANMDKWCVSKLKEVTTYISRGITPKYTDEASNSVLVINQRCIRDGKVSFENARLHSLEKKGITQEKMVQLFDILVNSTGVGTLGRVSQITNINEDMTVDSHVTIVRPEPNIIDKVFLGYSVKSQQSIIEHMAEGSTGQTELSRKRLGEEILVSYPKGLDEQKAIANILSTLDAKIETNKQINKTLEDMAQALFKHWFIDFEFPNEDGEPYQSSGGKMVESELGLIPEGWGVGTYDSVCEIASSKRIFASEYVSEGVPFYRSKEIIEKSAGRSISQPLFITEERFREIRDKFSVPTEGDILLTSVGTLGVPYIVGKEEFYFKDGNLTWFKNFDDEFYRYYIYNWILSVKGKEEIDAITIGSTQKAITINQLKTIKCLFPIDSLRKKYSDVMKGLLSTVKHRQSEIQKLEDIRDTLLPKLMSGEIRVPLDNSAS